MNVSARTNMAANATLHCLTGCAIGEILGLMIGTALGLLEEHMSHCLVEAAAAGGREAEEKVREASEAIARLVRS